MSSEDSPTLRLRKAKTSPQTEKSLSSTQPTTTAPPPSTSQSWSNVISLLPYQHVSFIYFVFSFFLITLRPFQARTPTFLGLEDPSHQFHVYFTHHAHCILGLLLLVIISYTTVVKAHNWNAWRHGMLRTMVAIGYPLIFTWIVKKLRVGHCDGDQLNSHFLSFTLYDECLDTFHAIRIPFLPFNLPLPHPFLFTLIHCSLVMREESLVFVRRYIHHHKSQNVAPQTEIDWIEDDKDNFEWFLWWVMFLLGIIWLVDIAAVGFCLGTVNGMSFSVLFGYAGWWLSYVQWYHRPNVPRPALPGNYHVFN